MMTVMDGLGWCGALMLLFAYACVSFKKIVPTSRVYQLLNATGGSFLVANTVYHGAFPPAFLNSVWAAIAVFALIRKAS